MENKIAIVYIDGFNLYHGMLEKGWDQYKWLDLYSFSRTLIPQGYNLGLVRYFTSHVKGDIQKNNRQIRYISALKGFLGNKIVIKYGSYQLFPSHCKHCKAKPVYCQQCGNEYSKPNEKKTDVNIATMIMVDNIDRITDCMILVSGDSDYEMTLSELKRLFPNTYRVIAFPPCRRNPSLFNLCDYYFDISESSFSTCQLPNPVKSHNGKLISKPNVWP